MDARQVIIRPVITEDSVNAMDDKKYTFEVDRRANKIEIRQAVEALFNVDVASVNVINMNGKPKRYGLYKGYTNKRKKAIVTLTDASDDIEIFADETEEDA